MYPLIAAVTSERIAELIVAKRHSASSRAHGGIEYGASHYPLMVALHTGLLAGCLLEVHALHRPRIPALHRPMVVAVLAAQGLRWWCIKTLGGQWNTRVIVVPGAPRVHAGPYRWLAHPNYVAVVVEGVALPLAHAAWRTALVFSLCNAALLRHRIRVENAALARLR